MIFNNELMQTYNTSIATDSKIIIALDFNNEIDVNNLITKLDPRLCKVKVGYELFIAGGIKLLEKLIISGYKVFLDLKLHDIPNTVYKACLLANELGVWMISLHISGGSNMLNYAVQAINEKKYSEKPLLIGVTVLTSMEQKDIEIIGVKNSIQQQVLLLAKLGFDCKLDGVVCSAQEAKMIKDITSNNFITVTPGISIDNKINYDQKRTMDPISAMKNKADYLVIGRQITQAKDPYEILLNLYQNQLLIENEGHNTWKIS